MHEDLLYDSDRHFTFNRSYDYFDMMDNFPRYIPTYEKKQEKNFGYEDKSWLLGFL